MSWLILLILLFLAKPIVQQVDKGYKALKASELGSDIKSFLGQESNNTEYDPNAENKKSA